MIATPNNMQRCADAGLQVIAVDPATEDNYSATAGDYWMMPADEPILGEFGDACYLAVKVTEYREVGESDLGGAS